MPKSMTTYRQMKIIHPEHSFSEIRGKRMAYHNYGNLKTYTNITQAEKRVSLLKELGFNVYRTYTFPFLILQND